MQITNSAVINTIAVLFDADQRKPICFQIEVLYQREVDKGQNWKENNRTHLSVLRDIDAFWCVLHNLSSSNCSLHGLRNHATDERLLLFQYFNLSRTGRILYNRTHHEVPSPSFPCRYYMTPTMKQCTTWGSDNYHDPSLTRTPKRLKLICSWSLREASTWKLESEKGGCKRDIPNLHVTGKSSSFRTARKRLTWKHDSACGEQNRERTAIPTAM